MKYIKDVKNNKQEDLKKINNSLVQFDNFIQQITIEPIDEHISIYEHWIDCMYDIQKIIVEEKKTEMKLKPKTEIITGNNCMRFEPIYRCYCPKCSQPLKRKNNICKCGQEIDWSEWE